MYHVRDDKRTIRSAEFIYQGLLACIKKKPLDQVTISDLQKVSGVARSTFYRAFDNISDVLYWKCDLCFSEILGSFQPECFRNEAELVLQYFRYWISHSNILEVLTEINRHDIIYACHMKNAELLRQRFGDLPSIDQQHGSYFIAIRTGFTLSILTTWLNGGRKESPEELAEILKEQIALLADSRPHPRKKV